MKNLSLLASALALVTACASDSPSEMSEMDGPSGELAVDAADAARVIRNQTIEVALELVRNESVGDVEVTVEGLPAGVTAEPLVLADGQTSAMLKLTAGDQIALGTELAVTIRATSGDVIATTPITIRLTDRPGAFDTSFGPGGERVVSYTPAHDEYSSVIAMQDDGKILVAGVDTDAKTLLVARLLENGELDPAFGDKGIVSAVLGNVSSYGVHGIAVRPDGVILVAMRMNVNGLIYAITPDGKPHMDYANSQGAMMLSQVNTGGAFQLGAIAANPDGSMVVAGLRGTDVVVTRLTPQGDFDSQFDHGGTKVVDLGGTDMLASITLDAQGRTLIAGSFTDSNNTQRFALARLANDGQLDETLSGDGVAGTAEYGLFPEGQFTHARALPDGRILALGFTDGSSSPVIILEPNGSFDFSKQVPIVDYVAMGSLMLDGSFVSFGYAYGDAIRGVVSKHTMTGTYDESFGDKGVSGMAPSPMHRDVAAGVIDRQGRLVTVGGQQGGDLDFLVTRIWL